MTGHSREKYTHSKIKRSERIGKQKNTQEFERKAYFFCREMRDLIYHYRIELECFALCNFPQIFRVFLWMVLKWHHSWSFYRPFQRHSLIYLMDGAEGHSILARI